MSLYLDHAATTPLAEPVWEAMRPYLEPGGVHANPASDHEAGAEAARAVDAARAQVAAAIGAQPEEIVFTSGATEANNLALKGSIAFLGGGHVVTTRTEHRAVLDVAQQLATQGSPVTFVDPEPDGTVSADAVIAAIRPDTALVSVMWVNNETGAINPVAAIAAGCAERGIRFHCDAAQALGRLAIDVREMPVALLSLSAHKCYGPKGIGALFVRRRPRARVAAQLQGGGHEQGMRSGTLATHQIVGFGVAANVAAAQQAADEAHARTLATRLRAGLAALPGLLVNGDPARCVPHIVNVAFDGLHGEALRAATAELAVASGSACSAAHAESSYVLRALGRTDRQAAAALRISTGRGTRAEDIDRALEVIRSAVMRLRAMAA